MIDTRRLQLAMRCATRGELVRNALAAGASSRQIAGRLGVSHGAVLGWARRPAPAAWPSRRAAVLGKYREAIVAAAAAGKATSIALVGSTARGEDTPDSDVDFLVTMAEGAGLFDLGGILADLEDLLGCDVDVISRDGLKPDKYQGHREMLAEAIPLSGLQAVIDTRGGSGRE